MSRKIWDGSQWVQIGGEVPDQIQGITQSDFDNLSTPDSSTIYAITNASGVGVANSMRINQELATKMYVGATEIWSPPVYATGGTITDIDVAGELWRVHTFTSSGQFEVLVNGLEVEYLVVGPGGNGGQGGGSSRGGGGGSGGEVYAATTSLNIGINTCTVDIASNTVFGSIQIAQKGGNGTNGLTYGGNGGSNGIYNGGIGGAGSNSFGGGWRSRSIV